MADGAIMLANAVESYLAVRRACGFELKSVGEHLLSFAEYSDAGAKPYVCSTTAIEWADRRDRLLSAHACWATSFGSHAMPMPKTHAMNYLHRYLAVSIGAGCSLHLLKGDIERLIQAALQPAYHGLRRDTYSTLFALLACTGLRVSEATRLRYQDITADGLVIRCSKFHKSRLVPLHDTSQAQLDRYLERRRRYWPFDDHVFISMYGKPLSLSNVDSAFRTAAVKIGIPCGYDKAPRATPHSLRHTFAVRVLEACPDDRDHITQNMLALSTVSGHGNVANTYWYLEATPELLGKIAERCESFVMGEKP